MVAATSAKSPNTLWIAIPCQQTVKRALLRGSDSDQVTRGLTKRRRLRKRKNEKKKRLNELKKKEMALHVTQALHALNALQHERFTCWFTFSVLVSKDTWNDQIWGFAEDLSTRKCSINLGYIQMFMPIVRQRFSWNYGAMKLHLWLTFYQPSSLLEPQTT